jgi:hypothetical protein
MSMLGNAVELYRMGYKVNMVETGRKYAEMALSGPVSWGSIGIK